MGERPYLFNLRMCVLHVENAAFAALDSAAGAVSAVALKNTFSPRRNASRQPIVSIKLAVFANALNKNHEFYRSKSLSIRISSRRNRSQYWPTRFCEKWSKTTCFWHFWRSGPSECEKTNGFLTIGLYGWLKTDGFFYIPSRRNVDCP